MRNSLISLTGLFLIAACTQNAAEAADKGAVSTTTPTDTTVETPSSAYSQFAQVVARHQAMSERVARISRRLRVANAPLCDFTRSDIGLTTHQLSDYPPNIRHLALHFMELEEEGRFVRSVIPGSPADSVAIQPGERIISGWPFQPDRPLVLDAGQGSFPVTVEADLACVAPAFVINSPELNASTDGLEIELSSALVETVGDDSALAFIIAHEMSHVLRAHDPEGPRWEIELEADRDALVLMRNAGFDIAGTVAGWEAGVEIHRESQAVSATHPPVEIRLRNLEGELARLTSLPPGFLPLN